MKKSNMLGYFNPISTPQGAYKATKKKWNQVVFVWGFGLLALASCNKEDSMSPSLSLQDEKATVVVPDGATRDYDDYSDVPGTHGTISRSGSLYSVCDFAQGSTPGGGTDSTWAEAGTYYFDFTNNDGAINTNYQITFTGSASGDIKARTAGGYSLAYIDKSFSTVTSSDSFTAATSNTIGLNYITTPGGTSGSGNGWYNYNLSTHIVTAVSGRTLILLQNSTPKFKFKINSLYSGGSPNAPSSATNYPYYSFDYEAL